MKKFLLLTLSVFAVTVGTLGMASCGSPDNLSISSDSNDITIESSTAENDSSSDIPTSSSSSNENIVPPKAGSLNFTLNEDGESYSLTGIGECMDTDLVIPSIYEGLPVTSIADKALRFNFLLTSVSIPDSVTAIGYGAFDACTSKLKILCSTDSYAHRYAVSYGLNVKG